MSLPELIFVCSNVWILLLQVAIPIVPTVRLVLTFNKFTYLQPSEEFFTPLSSPRHLSLPEDEEHQKTETGRYKSSWLNWHSNSTPKTSTPSPKVSHSSQVVDNVDPFSIPSEYTWLSSAPKSQRMMKSQSKKGLRNEALWVKANYTTKKVYQMPLILIRRICILTCAIVFDGFLSCKSLHYERRKACRQSLLSKYEMYISQHEQLFFSFLQVGCWIVW